MKSRKLVTSRRLALIASRAVFACHGSLAITRTRTPPPKTPIQAAPIQSQVHDMASTIAPPSTKAPFGPYPVVKGNSGFLDACLP
jgi:hypothetical protein